MDAVKKTGAMVRQTSPWLVSHIACVIAMMGRGGKNEELTNLNHESGESKRVVIEHDTANIADDLGDTTEDHADHEAPTPPFDTQHSVGDSNESEESEDSGISWQRRSVLVDTPFDGTAIEGTGGIGAEGNDTRGEWTRHVDGMRSFELGGGIVRGR
jgi:hypothetical protein